MVFLRVFCTLLFFLTGCSGVFFYPQKDIPILPDQIGLNYREVILTASDGVLTTSWYLPTQKKALGTILFLHGNAQNISYHLPSVYWLPEKGFNVLMVEYRGYGMSEGSPSFAGIKRDIEAAIAYLQNDNLPIIIFGQSLGGALALNVAGTLEKKGALTAVIVDSSFSDYRGIAREKLSALWLSWPFQWPLSLLISNDLSPKPVIQNISPVPLLLMHGESDTTVPVHHSEQLYALAKEPKELWVIPKKEHIEALRSEAIRNRLITYLLKTITKR